jgi:DNA-binding transcriptional MerR regulator
VERSFIPNPPLSSVGEETPRTTRARRPTAPATPASSWPATVTPVTKKDRLAACERLIAEIPLFRKLSGRHLRSVLRRAFDRGATISDIRHALDYRPDGSAWIHTHAPRWVPGWVRHRLSAWITRDGQLVALWPVQRRAVEHAALLAEQRARGEAYQRADQNRLGGPLGCRS